MNKRKEMSASVLQPSKKSPQDMHQYDDIIHLPHPNPRNHPRMSAQDRAAQFSPFAALSGHEDVIKEAQRRTESKGEFEEYGLPFAGS